jgi:predicted DNA-binding transcriptional regulator AlpA
MVLETMKKPDRPQAEQLRIMISFADVLKRIPLSRSTLERKVKEGTFPRSYPIAPMRVVNLLRIDGHL